MSSCFSWYGPLPICNVSYNLQVFVSGKLAHFLAG